jgi:hypothetical protein
MQIATVSNVDGSEALVDSNRLAALTMSTDGLVLQIFWAHKRLGQKDSDNHLRWAHTYSSDFRLNTEFLQLGGIKLNLA